MKRTTTTEARTKTKTAAKTGTKAAGAKHHGQSICTTCNNREDCAVSARSGSPIMHCDEFDDRQEIIAAAPELEVAAVKEPETGNYTGICVNCEERTECIRSSTEGGIWHCEEYR